MTCENLIITTMGGFLIDEIFKRFVMICLFFSAVYSSMQAQIEEISGVVKSGLGTLSGVVITVTTEDENNVLMYTITDQAGHFTLKNVDMTKGKFVCARLMGFETQKIPLMADKIDYMFLLKEVPVELKEVLIKAAPVSGSGDTTRYLTSSFAQKNDLTLGDVLKRMPGFTVFDDGRIKYNGKEISDFYIEGSDIMSSKYSIAVNSLRHDDVGSVEAIENHQPIKLFEDLLFSNKTAVNITLKEKAKNRWAGMIHAGAGLPRQWDMDANIMRFARKIKMLSTYKGNNTGNNVSSMALPALSLEKEEEDARQIIVPQSVRNPYLEERKTLFNRSHLLSLNGQVLVGKSFALTPQLDLNRSTFENTIEEERHYFLENGRTLHIAERESGTLREYGISPTLRLEANTRKMYFLNILSSSIKWQASDLSVTGTYPNEVNKRMDYTYVRNFLNLLYRRGRKVIGIQSENRWSRRPQHIDILQSDTSIHEHIETFAFYSQASTTQSLAFGIATLSIEEGYRFSRHLLQSHLEGLRGFSSSQPVENDFDYRHTQLYASPSLSLRRRVWSATLSVPLSYQHTVYEDCLAGQSYRRNKWLWSPSVSTVWAPNNHWSVSLNGGWKRLPDRSEHFYTSPLMSAYPYLQTGTTGFLNAETAHAGAMIRYKNILQGLFGNIHINRQWTHHDLMVTQDFGSTYIVTGFVQNPYTVRSDHVLGSMSYMINAIRGGLTLKGLFSTFDSRFMQNGQPKQATTSMRQLSLQVYSSPSDLLNIDYTCTYSEHAHRLKEEARRSTHTLHQKLSLTVIPTEKLNFVVIGNHYYHTLGSENKHFWLLDANVNYRLSSLWSFRLAAQNVFDQREFTFLSYTDMMSLKRTYRIRPASIVFSVITSL